MGYRYYETRAAAYDGPVALIGEQSYANGEEWYNANVVFPFGYGLSYTDFTWTVDGVYVDGREFSLDSPLTFDGDSEISITVNVHNDGEVAGKDVVQLYVTPPYTEGGIEKSHVVLSAFEKTR